MTPRAMNSAAVAHNQARLGDIAAHQRRAIGLLTQAQRVWTPETHTVDWAMTQNNLGVAWADLPTGDRGENLGKAIACYTAALEVLSAEWLSGGHGTAEEFDAIAPADG